jgi:antitoxin component YwqK of YwqJK toxin-antitoxin module
LDGSYTTWRENGLRWVEGTYKKGLKVGAWTTWNDMGLILSQEEYEAGKLVSTTSASSQ